MKKISKAKRETRSTDKPVGYVDKKKLLASLLEWQLAREKSEADGDGKIHQMPDFVASAIIDIATGLGNKSSYSKYTYRDEMVGDAILQCCKYIKNFDAKRGSSPFAYITEVCTKTFWSRMATEKRHNYIALKQALDSNLEGLFEVESDDNALDNKSYQLEAVEDFIKKYEEKNEIGQYAKRKKGPPKSSKSPFFEE